MTGIVHQATSQARHQGALCIIMINYVLHTNCKCYFRCIPVVSAYRQRKHVLRTAATEPFVFSYREATSHGPQEHLFT